MKARPILFSAPMVLALLEGRKPQTRRAISRPLKHPSWTGYTVTYEQDGAIECGPDYPDDQSDFVRCPYGKPGDLLWVKETWWNGTALLGCGLVKYRAEGELNEFSRQAGGGWKPSIHMPRWASRLSLELTEVRVQRLQDISEADAMAEGIKEISFYPDDGWPLCAGYLTGMPSKNPWPESAKVDARGAYRELWESISGPGSWEANPWMWVLEFRVYQQNIDEFIKSREAA